MNQNQQSDNQSLQLIKEKQELDKIYQSSNDKPLMILCWASWDKISENLKSMMEEMPKIYKQIRFLYIDCDEAEDIIDFLNVDTVQTLVVMHPQPSTKEQKIERHLGLRPQQLTDLVENLNNFYKDWHENEKKRAFRDIEGYISQYPFFIFIKGTKQEPKCKFTRRLVELLGKFEYEYQTFNILGDERIRYWLKSYSNWPTFPQAFINQKFIGGIDIIQELVDGGELDDMVPQICKPLPPKERLAKSLKDNKITLLLSRNVEYILSNENEDLESKTMAEQINSLSVEYAVVDASSNKEIFELFQNISVPYLFLNGKPTCGLDGLNQLIDSKELQSLSGNQQKPLSINERIEKLLNGQKIILFMKGTPSLPQCGFSQRIVNLLKKYDGIKYDHFNIFEDNEIREGLKKYSNWPTYPQLYVNGKLIGGIDIVQELDEEGELLDTLNA